MDVRLTEHFTLADFTRSETATLWRIDNSLPDELMDAAREHAKMLEDVRYELSVQKGYEVPVYVTSGFRCPPLNWCVRNPRLVWTGQVDPTGDHPLMRATDIKVPDFGTPLQVCRALAPHVDKLGIGQMIQEGSWAHLSSKLVDKPINRIITAVAGGYVPGLVTA